MYEELVKSLRAQADYYCCHMGINSPPAMMFIEAADAIEELVKENESLAVDLADSNERRKKKRKPQWIPVTEQLPESGVHVLACCCVKWVGGGGRSYVCDAFYSSPKTEICSYNEDIESEYDEETDEYYMPEGWWEVIKNWDDYSCVAIADFVTHWMPLPEPPRDGE